MEEIVHAIETGRGELVGVACEKPLGRTAAEARKMLELVEKVSLLDGYLENRHMVRSFLAGERPRENFSHGVSVAELLMTAYMSAEQGRTIEFPPADLESFIPAVAQGTWNPREKG